MDDVALKLMHIYVALCKSGPVMVFAIVDLDSPLMYFISEAGVFSRATWSYLLILAYRSAETP